MKTKTCLLLSFIVTVALDSRASEITNSVNIITNINLVFCLGKIAIAGPQSQFKSGELIDSIIIGPSTNYVFLRRFPSGNFDFHLFDESDKEVAKTKAGLALTGLPPMPKAYDDIVAWRTRRFTPFVVGEGGVNYDPLFRPDDIFMITNKGIYELEIKMRFCVIMTNGMPDISAMLDGRNGTGRGVPYIKDFGVLTSPPLRVKIVKE